MNDLKFTTAGQYITSLEYRDVNPLIAKLKQQAGVDFNPDQEGLDLFARLVAEQCAKIAQAGLAPAAVTVINQTFGIEE